MADPGPSPVEERQEVESYLQTHQLEDNLNAIINRIVREKPKDPFVVMADLLKDKSPMQSGILNVFAREVLDSKGVPTVEVDVTTHKGVFSAVYPCKLSGTGPDDPKELRDADDHRFHGYGVTKVVQLINEEIAPDLMNLSPEDQPTIDEVLLSKTKPTKDKDGEETPGMPFMATLTVSMAICRAGARHADKPLWEYIACLAGRSAEDARIPVPAFSVINGGLHAANKLLIQELMVMPDGAKSFAEAMQMAVEIYIQLKGICKDFSPEAINVGELGGFTPQVESEQAIEMLLKAIEKAGHTDNCKIAIDMAASQFSVKEEPEEDEEDKKDKDKEDSSGDDSEAEAEAAEAEDEEEDDDEDQPESIMEYNLDTFKREGGGTIRDSDDLLDMYREWLEKFPLLVSIEDPFDRKDGDFFFKLKQAVHEAVEGEEPASGDDDEAEEAAEGADAAENSDDGDGEEYMFVGGEKGCKLQVVADELLATPADVNNSLKADTVNAMVVDIAKRATVTGSVRTCTKVQASGWSVIVGGRSGETTDTFISDLAVGVGAGQFKCGAPCHSEHIAKYNQLLRVASAPNGPPFTGKGFRKPPVPVASKPGSPSPSPGKVASVQDDE